MANNPTLISIVEAPSGDTFTLNLSGAVAVQGGVPWLILSDGVTASFTGPAGNPPIFTNSLIFTVPAGQSSPGATVTEFDLGGTTIKDVAGNAANLTLATTPVISGTAQEGQILTASGGAAQADVAVTYQWLSSVNGGFPTPIGSGATYQVQEGDEGNTIEVSATVNGVIVSEASAVSAPTAPVIDITPTLTTPLISATVAQEGQTLTATAAVANDSDATVAYQWQESFDGGTTWQNIGGATGLSFLVAPADVGAKLEIVATSTDPDGSGTVATSAATSTGGFSVTINGLAQEGQTLTASVSTGQADDSVTYQWFSSADAFTNPIGSGFKYPVQEGDEGNTIEVVATATGQPVPATRTTDVVLDAPPTVTDPTISGVAQEGQTLTASASAGQSDNAVTYQWFGSADGFTDSIGSGAMYQVQESDEGNTLEVIATATNENRITTSSNYSAPTASVMDATLTVSKPVINGFAQEGQILTASAAVANDSDAVISYKWQVQNGSNWNNIAGATASTYQVTEANEGHQLRVTATPSDANGSGPPVSSAPTASVIDLPPALVSVTVSGVPREGQLLATSATAVSDGDGGKFTYQWQASVGSNWINIAGATHATYRATEAVEGDKIRVLLTFKADKGQPVTLASVPTTPVLDVMPALSVTVTGTAQEGQKLTAHPLVTGDGDGGNTTYQWQKLVGTNWTNIAGAAASTYQVAEQDEDSQIRVAAAFTDDTGQVASATSAATTSVIDIKPTLSVTVTGVAQDGQTLMATAIANDSDAIINYQWQQLMGATWTNIAGATGSTFAVTEANEGSRLRAVATSLDNDGSGTSATSTATASVVDPPPTLTIPNPSLFVAAGGSVSLPISVSGYDSDDKVSVKIAGLPTFETITDNLDKKSLSGTSVTLTAAEVNSGLTLHSSYGGVLQPIDILTVTTTNAMAGEAETSAAQTITVTDPPDQRVALLGQYIASTFATSGAGDAAILAADPMTFTPQQVSLVQPQH